MNGWVPLKLAASMARRPVQTLHTWRRRELVPSACRVEDHELLVWWPAVYDQTTDAEHRAPRMRRAS